MDDDNLLAGKIQSPIGTRKRSVVPLCDVPEKNSRESFGRELDLSGNARNVVGWNNTTHDRRKLNDRLSHIFQLLIIERHVTRSEIHGARLKLLDSSTAADRLIINLDVGVCLMKFAEPLGINRIGKSCAGGIQVDLRTRRGYCRNQERERWQSSHQFKVSVILLSRRR